MPGDTFEADLAGAREDLERLVRRLRSLSSGAWRDRRVATQSALDGLVALQAHLEGRLLDPPTPADHVLADAIAVVGGDVLEVTAANADGKALAELRSLIATALRSTG